MCLARWNVFSTGIKRGLRNPLNQSPVVLPVAFLQEMAYSYFLTLSTLLFFAVPTYTIFFGGSGGGGGCCGGCGRKKRSIEDQEEDRFHADHSDKLCNNPDLKRFIRQQMNTEPATSKTNLVNALYPEGDHFFVVCTTGDSTYSAPRTSVFCSATSFNHTCYVFGF